ncbi:hypothetical protein [Roseateles sp.]|uniref:hypothetical protein n=1 Tax=Roseateles sp. TaxID=1971397 RepID=UPI0031D78304
MKDTQVAAPSVESSNGSNPINAQGSIKVGGIEAGGKWDYSLDGEKTWTTGTGDSISANALAEGANHVTIRQTDAAGNQSTSQLDVVKDTTVSMPTVTPSNGANPINGSGSVAVSGLEAGAKWDYSLDNGATWKQGAGSSIAASDLSEGTNHITIRQTDSVGNQAATSIDVVKDTQVAAPSVESSNGSNPINAQGSIKVGGIEAGGKWDYSLDGEKTWTSGTGDSISANALAEGANHVTIRQTDLAGNQASTSIDVTKDSQVAAPEVIQDADGTIRIDRIETGAAWFYSVDGGKNWTTGTGSTLPFSALPATDNSLLVRQTDLAGNSATSKATFVTKDPLVFSDVTPPAAPSLSLARDVGTAWDDKVSPDATVKVSGLEDGGSWQYSLDRGITWTTGVGSTIDSAVFGTDGDKSVQVRQFDRKGNESTTSSLSFTLNTTTIDQVPLTLALKSPGAPGQNGLVTVGNAAIHATVPENIFAYKIEYDWEDNATYKAIWSPGLDFDITNLLSDGQHSVRAVIYENTEQGLVHYSNSLHFVLDRGQSSGALPAAPTLRLSNDTGISSTDLISKDGTINVTGLADGATLLYGPAGGSELNRTTDRVIPSSYFGGRDGTKSVVVHQVDKDGKVSEGTTITFTLDATAPNAPTLATSSGVELINKSGNVTVAGLESGVTWEYSLDGGQHWLQGQGASISGASFNEGANAVVVRQIDKAGNTGAISASLNVALDSEAPAAPQPMNTVVNNQSVVKLGTAQPGEHFEVDRRDGSGWEAISGDTVLDVAMTAGLPVHVRAVDAAGNVSPEATYYTNINNLQDGMYEVDVGKDIVQYDQLFRSYADPAFYGHTALVQIKGGDVVDTLAVAGTAGDDRLVAATSFDTLLGGSGADVFWILQFATSKAVILDYSQPEGDVVDLSTVLSNFDIARQDQFVQKKLFGEGNVELLVDVDGNGNFSQPDLTIYLVHPVGAGVLVTLAPAGVPVAI